MADSEETPDTKGSSLLGRVDVRGIKSLKQLGWDFAGYSDDSLVAPGARRSGWSWPRFAVAMVLLLFGIFMWWVSKDAGTAVRILSLSAIVVAVCAICTSPFWAHRLTGMKITRFIQYSLGHIFNILTIAFGILIEAFTMLRVAASFFGSEKEMPIETISTLLTLVSSALLMGYISISTAPTIITVGPISRPLLMIRWSRRVVTIAVAEVLLCTIVIASMNSGYVVPIGVLITVSTALMAYHGSALWRITGIASNLDASLRKLDSAAQYALEGEWNAKGRHDLRSALQELRSACSERSGSKAMIDLSSDLCASYEYRVLFDWAFYRIFGGEKTRRLVRWPKFEEAYLNKIPDTAIPALLLEFTTSTLDDLREQSKRSMRKFQHGPV